MILQCPKCTFKGLPNLEEVGTQTKAICPQCNAYIKWVASKDLIAWVANMNKIDEHSAEYSCTEHVYGTRNWLISNRQLGDNDFTYCPDCGTKLK